MLRSFALLFVSSFLILGTPAVASASPADTVLPATDPADSIGGSSVPETTVAPTTVAPTTVPPAAEPSTTESSTTEPLTTEPEAASIDPATTGVADGAVVGPSAAPQVRSSDIHIGSILFALFVLAVVGLVSYVLARRSPGAHVPSPTPDRTDTVRPVDDTVTLDFLLGLGESLIDAGDAVSHVESTLRSIAQVNGVVKIGVVVLPTALIVSLPGGSNVTTEVGIAGRAPLRLDQIDDVLGLVREAERGDLDAAEGQRRLSEIRVSPHPYSSRLVVLGYVCSTVGLAMILRATWREVVLAAVLGAVIGSFRLSTRRLGPSSQPFVPLIAATAVSISVFALARVVDDLATFPLLVSPLITFLPGALLTVGALELVTGDIVAGGSRLASGVMQLVLVALGVVAGRQLVGVPVTTLRHAADGPIATLAPWVGVAVFGVGVVWFNGARTASRNWIVLVLYVAYAGQVIGGLFFGSALSAFFGALAMTPIALFAARQSSGPTPLVTFLPGFWILVPGALGLEGITQLLDGGAGVSALVTTATSMVGISLGILLGLGLAAGDPEHPWAEAEPRRPRSRTKRTGQIGL